MTPCTKTARYLRLIFRQRMLENITFKMNLVSRLAAADCASGVAGNIDISEHTCTIIYHPQDPDNMDVLEVTFPKNGSLFFKHTSPYIRTQYFLSNEPSQPFGRSILCAWQSSKLQHCETLWHCNISPLLQDMTLAKTPCTKTARYLRLIFRQRRLENITFKMNLVSRLAATDCTSGVAGNIEISKHTCTIIYHQQNPDNMDVLEVIVQQNGSLFFKNTSPYIWTQYFLSNEPSQPFGRSSLCAWQSSKLQHCETLWHCNISP